MPELPDVEIYKQYLNATALYQDIKCIHLESFILLSGTTPQSLGRALKHKSFRSTERHGKYLFIELNPFGWLVLHFGMTGYLKHFQHKVDRPNYAQFIITFENGFHLAYISRRKLGQIALTDKPQQFVKSHHLGPDALDLTLAHFYEQASKRRKNVKSWLMDQHIIAGIGNIYSDEILYHAKIQPQKTIGVLDQMTLVRLYQTIAIVLKTAIEARANPEQMPSTFLLPQRKQGGHCPECATPIEKIKIAGRYAWYCPRCQKS